MVNENETMPWEEIETILDTPVIHQPKYSQAKSYNTIQASAVCEAFHKNPENDLSKEYLVPALQEIINDARKRLTFAKLLNYKNSIIRKTFQLPSVRIGSSSLAMLKVIQQMYGAPISLSEPAQEKIQPDKEFKFWNLLIPDNLLRDLKNGQVIFVEFYKELKPGQVLSTVVGYFDMPGSFNDGITYYGDLSYPEMKKFMETYYKVNGQSLFF